MSGHPVFDRPRRGVMPEVLVLLRHGHSEGQEAQERAARGDLSAYTPMFRNTPSSRWNLTRYGFAQAQRAGLWMREHLLVPPLVPERMFDRGWFSPHDRSRQTLGGVALHVPIRGALTEETRLDPDAGMLALWHDVRLRELDFGEVATIPKHEYEARYPGSVHARRVDPLYGRTPGGESVADLMDRGRSYLGALARRYQRGERVVIAAGHGRQITALQLVLEGIRPADWEEFTRANEIKNTQVVAYSRRDPCGQESLSPTYHWTSSTCPWETPDQPPRWRRFEAPAAMSVQQCLEGIPETWLRDPPAGPPPA